VALGGTVAPASKSVGPFADIAFPLLLVGSPWL